ncbi:protein of unknown function [Collimonas sp. OK607]|uniref:STAS-like domain-containing protein n=1 Tax=Collimonas sp. OK607 TaxID=1798194 RepID=UPI0008E9DA25|nr:STAS-like domain-containing protein [Collimonas sp. OK607]SFB12019.1 protein of unknown function [Collimonas sp. OK607]
MSKMIKIATDFSEAPAGRFYDDGPFPGAKFRDEILVPAIREYESVLIDLDGTAGYGSSFLEEAFGGAVRLMKLSVAAASAAIKFKSSDESLVMEIQTYIRDAAAS